MRIAVTGGPGQLVLSLIERGLARGFDVIAVGPPELDLAAPIVSVSLGLPAIFLFGGLKRSDKPSRFRLQHGDIAVWGGPARLAFHGVAPLADGEHALLGRQRINLTFRKAG